MRKLNLRRSMAGIMLTLALAVSLSSSLLAAQTGGGDSDERGFDTGIVAFGDSLTDTGNMFGLTNECYPVAGFYFDGHFSNGMIWIEYVAEAMGIEPESVTNYAVGGATTGRDNTNDHGLSE